VLVAGGNTYRGNLEFHPDGADIQCVNSLSMRDYLRGVVPKEMGRRDAAGLEALKAQAVVARTYAFKRMAARSGAVFDVHASVQDQVYGGASVEYPLSDRAVAETDGLVVLHADTLALCYYHSTCGGVTADRREVWNGPPTAYLVSRSDRDETGQAWCRASNYLQWTQAWESGALAGILRSNLSAAAAYGAPSFRALRGFHVRERFACGRIRALEIETDGGSFTLYGDKIRFGLKPGNGKGRILESARFDIALENGRVTARGSGFGHGVGLCQMGALGRSQAGHGFARILAAYYPGTALGKAK
jgi:stage II sporulation protein D